VKSIARFESSARRGSLRGARAIGAALAFEASGLIRHRLYHHLVNLDGA
jgi:hypothetical protein